MSSSRVFEIRSYTAAPGRLEELKERFATRTVGLFERHGMEVLAFFEPIEEADVLVYLLGFESEAGAERAWEGFFADPEWAEVKRSTESNGPLVASMDNRRYRPSSFSPLQ